MMHKRGWSSENSTSSSDDAPKRRKRTRDDEGATSLIKSRNDIKVEFISTTTSTASSSHESTDGEEKKAINYLSAKGQYSDFSSRMMAKMGYKAGKGLGAKQQGRVEPVEATQQRGRRGLGLKIKAMAKEVVVEWEDEKPPSATETVEWMPRCDLPLPTYEDLCEWSVEGKRKLTIDDETVFCDEEILQTMLTCKSIFDDLEGQELRHARTRCNPYETIRGGIFLNRAAMKMANMDHVFDSLFTMPKDLAPNETLYFADVCAGPGGFSEYVLWRKKWRAKGFGFTLKGKNDFKLGDFFAADPEFFEPHYGVNGVEGDGDIMNTDNLEAFHSFVIDNTDGKGVHFLMADGGFSVEGQENIQEILSKQLTLCQFACALSVVRIGGSFVCKTFDLFTPFSASLVYLLRRAFEVVTIFKPLTSRPANSERYVVCKGYRDPDRLIGDFLLSVNETLNDLKGTENDVATVVPLDILLEDTEFCAYLQNSNENIAKEQCKALAKIHAFAKDRNLKELTQTKIRRECLELWKIPDKVRSAPEKTNAKECFGKHTRGMRNPISTLKNQVMLQRKNLQLLEKIYDYRCCICTGRRTILVSLGGARIYEWNHMQNRWTQSDVRCRIPRETVLEVEIVSELKGEGKGQRRTMAVHVIDAIVLGGENISSKHYTQRMTDIGLFVKAIRKTSLPDLNVIRAKTIFRSENIKEVFDSLCLKRIKSGGVEPRLCCMVEDSENCFVPSGLCFIKITKDPWAMAFSKSKNRKYFFNTATKESSFECPAGFCATYDMCASNRFYWSWEEGVKVIEGQQHKRPGSLSSDEVVEFMQQHK